MSFLKELFKTKEQREKELADAISKRIKEDADLAAKVAEQTAERLRLEAEEAERVRIAEAEEVERIKTEHAAALLQAKFDSDTPWFEPIIGADPHGLLHERYHWNKAFISSLSKKGFHGETAAQIFQAYLDEQDAIERRRVVEEEREVKRNSSEPWVEVIGEKINDDGQIELQLDWNSPFIKYLRLNGFRGATDDIIVQQWLLGLDRVLDNPETYQ
jgi:hypothetical protein